MKSAFLTIHSRITTTILYLVSPLPFSHVFYPGGVDFDAGGNGGALLMDDESSKKDAKKERVIEDSFLTDDQLSSRSENFLTWE